IFNPEDSIDFQGHTGPFIQYTYVRTRSVLRRYEGKNFEQSQHALHETERDIIILLHDYCATLQRAADSDDVSIVAEYAYQVARAYSKLWSEVKILNEEDENLVAFRVAISRITGEVLADAMSILGISMPERM
ncbi:MAG: DALR anticodon-binding domain-containing protein, partial [Bacteroidota bacterium]|nr:DALR anticodon-binding domain-containing protein [Bacteroidota bacterium]